MAATISQSGLRNRTTSQDRSGDINARSGTVESPMDLLCVGFGLPSIAIAAGLADCNPDGRVCFFERQHTFSWRPASTLPENRVRTPFLRDLISMRNPRSRFTFVNYLYSTNQLVAYTNASSLYPSKLVMSQYLAWAAEEINKLGWVRYGSEVVRIEPVKVSGANQVSKFAVYYKDITTKKVSVVTSKRVVVATGSSPFIPKSISVPELASHVIHSTSFSKLFSQKGAQIPDVAVVGASQEGAEIFEELQAHYGTHRATYFVEDSALRPVDTTAFAQLLTDLPDSDLAAFPPEVRKKLLLGNHARNENPISLELIEHLYDMDYAQKIGEKDSNKWRFAIEPLAQVVGTEFVGGSSKPRIRLQLRNPRTGATRLSERSFDVVVAATGYQKAAGSLLSSITPLLAEEAVSVSQDYRVNFKDGLLQSGCGLYSLGALQDHSARDEAFLHLAEQGRRVTESLVKLLREEESKQGEQFEARL